MPFRATLRTGIGGNGKPQAGRRWPIGIIKYLGQAMNLDGIHKALAMHMKDHSTIIIETEKPEKANPFYSLYGTEMRLNGDQLKAED